MNFILLNKDFKEALTKHRDGLAEMFKKLAHSPEHERPKQARTINAKVMKFNKDWPKAKNYFDLHGLTSGAAAVFYVRQILAETLDDEILLETGKGVHSKEQLPKIKRKLQSYFGQSRNFSISEDVNNKGVLVLRRL